MTAGLTLESAYAALRRDNVDVDAETSLLHATNGETHPTLVSLLVRRRILRAQRYGGEMTPEERARFDRQDRVDRIVARFSGDRSSVPAIAADEGVSQAEVEQILQDVVQDRVTDNRAARRAAAVAAEARRQEARERARKLRELYHAHGRRFPVDLEKRILEAADAD